MRTILLSFLLGATALAAEPPALRSVLICEGAQSPTWVGTPPNDASRLFVLEQRTGLIRLFDRTAKKWKPNPVLAVDNVQGKENEQGLLGMAFHPQFAKNGFIYLYYTAPGGGNRGHVEIARFTVAGDVADPASKQIVINIDQPEGNHNGGWIEFGSDGYLWLGIGDGGGGNDRHGKIGFGQALNSLRGKILRLDVDSKQPYAVPKDNPFTEAGQRPEIAAFGLRNPWRCGFDRKTGDLWIGDVGQNEREEIDVMPKGRLGQNFGWRVREGFIQTPAYPNEKPVSKPTDPVVDYPRDQGKSVTGGYVYRGKALPGLAGWYLYADFVTQRFWRLDADAVRAGGKATPVDITGQLNPDRKSGSPSTFGLDADGEVFFTGWNNGRIYQIVAAP